MAQKTKINDEKAKRDYGLREDKEFIRTSEKKMNVQQKWATPSQKDLRV